MPLSTSKTMPAPLTAANMVSWQSLPTEVRIMVLEHLIQDGNSLASFATVSREWQIVIERHNFAHIRLTPSHLADFGSMVRRNSSLVHYIWLCLELQEYDCTECNPGDPVLWGMNQADNTLITAAFQDLFSALSAWEANGELVLDISVYSPSDSKHWFKYLTFEPDISSEVCITHFPSENEISTKPDDRHHGWDDGHQESLKLSTEFSMKSWAKARSVTRSKKPNGGSNYHRCQRLRASYFVNKLVADGSQTHWLNCLPVYLGSNIYTTNLGENGSMFSKNGRTSVSSSALTSWHAYLRGVSVVEHVLT